MSTSSLALPSDEELIRLAGKGAFDRGGKYALLGRVVLSRHDGDGFAGQAEGEALYQLRLRRDGLHWQWDCSCPAADGGAFCKHLVAAVLIARDGPPDQRADEDETDDDAPPPPRRGKASGHHALAEFLRAQPAERLAQWLLAFADDDADIAKRLQLYSAQNDPAELKAALGRLLQAGGVLDYRRSIAYARKLDEVIAQLEDTIAQDPKAGRTLCEYVLGRLQTVYARADDSSGAIGGQLQHIAHLHAQACTAAAPGKALAKSLQALRQKDDWGMFPLAAYWNALGAEGQSAIAKPILAAFEALPAKATEATRWGAAFGTVRQAEELARVTHDFDLLQRVLRRDLSRPHDYLQVLESLHDAGREREALDWVEQAVKRFPKEAMLRDAFAENLARAGLHDEATEQTWQAFHLQPNTRNWDALKRRAGSQWAAWRERALQDVITHERNNVSLRVILLAHDNDLEAAIALARTQPIRLDVLDDLACRIQHNQPDVAGALQLRRLQGQLEFVDGPRYAALVQTLERIARCLPPAQWQPLVAKIRIEHARKTKLMKMLDEAGL